MGTTVSATSDLSPPIWHLKIKDISINIQRIPMSFRVVFVLDLLDGSVVHGVRGERDKYRPVHEFSQIVDTSDPVRLVEEIRPREVYVADLDRLMDQGDNDSLVESVSKRCPVMLDLGASTTAEVEHGLTLADQVVVGTETATTGLLESISGMDVAVSLDLKDGRVLANDPSLRVPPREVIDLLNGVDIGSLIVLDLDRVGTKTGFDPHLLADIASRSRHPVLLGGGVRGVDDLERLVSLGVSGALVATAVHDGSIPLDYI